MAVKRSTSSIPTEHIETGSVSQEVERLREELGEVYRVLDDIRSHLQWATNNASSLIEQMPRCHVTSLARDPCDPEWGSKVNGVTPAVIAQLREQAAGQCSRVEPTPILPGETSAPDVPLEEFVDREPAPSNDAATNEGSFGNRPLTTGAKAKKEPLYMRLVFVPALTDLVRAVRYDFLTASQLPDRVQALQDKYGPERLRQAIDEILIKDAANANLWRLSDEARHYAFQIIGQPPTPPAAGTSVSAAPEAASSPLREDSPVLPAAPPIGELRDVRMTRAKAILQYREWLTETGQTYDGLTAEQEDALMPQVQTLPDFVVSIDELRQLVLVSRSPTKTQRADMEQWIPVFGPGSEPVAVWPMQDVTGKRHWRTHVIATDDE